MIRQVIQRISNPEASIESLQERRFWLQCERAYTWQPIYQTCGRLMAVELLTAATHPLNPSQRLPPDRYFTEITVSHRMEVVKEQIDLLAQKADFFIEHGLLASVNIDGPTLIALRQQPKILRQIERLPGCVSNWWSISVCRKIQPLPRCVNLARCGWMILVPGWQISLH